MIIGFNQKDTRLLKEIQSDGCLFLCFAEASPIIFEGATGIKHLNLLWNLSKEVKYINTENEIVEHDRIAQNIFGLHVKYDNIHHDADEPIPANVSLVFGQFFWKYGHFVIINKEKEVTFDSLVKSYSVQNGALKSMRWYYAV